MKSFFIVFAFNILNREILDSVIFYNFEEAFDIFHNWQSYYSHDEDISVIILRV